MNCTSTRPTVGGFILGVVLLGLGLVGQSAVGQSPDLIDFELKDQFDQVHRRDTYTADVVVIVGSDREGSAYNGPWATALADALGPDVETGKVEFLGVADLSAVPFFLRRMVKSKFPKGPDDGVLLDWRGLFARSYGFESGVANLVAFCRTGELIHQSQVRSVTSDDLDEIVRSIRVALASNDCRGD